MYLFLTSLRYSKNVPTGIFYELDVVWQRMKDSVLKKEQDVAAYLKKDRIGMSVGFCSKCGNKAEKKGENFKETPAVYSNNNKKIKWTEINTF